MAYEEVHMGWDHATETIAMLDCSLKADQENLILVYGGSFNPPHRGHVDVLLAGLRPEVDALAIVVLPCEDYLLRSKMSNAHSEFFLHMQRRSEIWSALPSIPKDRVWVWSSTYFPFILMTEALLRLTKADGYRVAYSQMIGPDNLRLNSPLAVLPYVFPRIFVTNRARHSAHHFTPDGTPVIWHGFGPWTRSLDQRAKVSQEEMEDEVVFWHCEGASKDDDTQKRGYYLQFSRPSTVDISSTSLRRILNKDLCLDERQLNQLSIHALLELLAPMLAC